MSAIGKTQLFFRLGREWPVSRQFGRSPHHIERPQWVDTGLSRLPQAVIGRSTMAGTQVSPR